MSNKIPVKKLVNRNGKQFVQTFYVSPEEHKEHQSKTNKSSKQMHTDSQGNYTAERLRMHNRIIDNVVDSCPLPREGEKPTAILLLGGAASGKSTVVNKFIKPKFGTDFGTVNVDDVKESISEYKDFASQDVMTAANRVHEESSDIGKQINEQVIMEGRNFIFDAVLGNSKKAKELISKLRDNGYNIKLVGVNVNAEDALNRAKSRALGDKERLEGDEPKDNEKGGSGRYVPDNILLEGHKGSSQTFEDIKDIVDDVELYDNNVDFGSDPIKVMDNKQVYRKDLYENFKNKKNINTSKDVKKSWIQSLRDLISPSAKIVDENNQELSKADLSRIHLQNVLAKYLSNQVDTEELQKSYNEEIEELDEIAKANSAVQARYEAQRDIIEQRLIKNTQVAHQNRNEALEVLKKAISDHSELIKQGDFIYKKYLESSLGRTRDTMPQIESANIDDVILHFQGKSPNTKVSKETINIQDIKFIQGEINEDKVLKILEDQPKQTTRFLVAKGKNGCYLIDGHHRFCAFCELDSEMNIEAYVIHLEPLEAVRRLNLMKISGKSDINKGIDYSERLKRLRERRDPDGIESKNLYAASIIQNNEGRVLFLKRHPEDDFHPSTLCLPSGGIEEGEEPEEAAIRELKEETGLDGYVIDRAYTANNKESIVYYFVVGVKDIENQDIVLDKEHSNYMWLDSDEWKDEDLILDLGGHLDKIFGIKKAEESFELIRKAFNDDQITVEQYREAKEQFELIKAKTDLVKKVIWVNRGGKTFQQTVYVNPKTDEMEETPIGEELAPSVSGMNITKYSDKAILIAGDTYVNKDTLRKVKEEIGVGSWNRKLNGWVFPIKFKDTILGSLWGKLVDSGNEDKAAAIQNQKNAAFEVGDKVSFNDTNGTILNDVSDSSGIKYEIELDNGNKMKIDERLLSKSPMTDDKKISEKINQATPENRPKIQKQIFGFKPIEDIHNYSLFEYMGMHGISESDIVAYLSREKKQSSGEKKSNPSVSRDKSKPSEGLTKNQIIARLIAKHKQAVSDQISNGNVVPDNIVEVYEDLKGLNEQLKKTLSEEHKRKISEALKRNNPAIEQEILEVSNQSTEEIDRANYSPLKGQDFVIEPTKGEYNGQSVTISSKDYTNVPAVDIMIPKPSKILDATKPYFIPNIDLEKFKRNSYTLSSIKIDDDKYLVALDGFNSGRGYSYTTKNINKLGNFAIMSLDSMTATENYYQLKAKAAHKKEQDEYVKRRRKEIYEFLIKQGNSEEQAAEMADKRKIRTTRISVLSKNKMTYDQMDMIKAFNENASRADIWNIYRDISGEKRQKSSDIALHQEYIDSSYSKGQETSYGDSNTKDNLLNEYGVKVKRQNGDDINDSEISQIKNSLDSVSSVFGKNIDMNKAFGLKISHSGDKLMHARQASGIFHPVFNVIGVSSMFGDESFKFTFGHEYAHFMDYWIGKSSGNHYASDKQGSTANRIASTLRKNMNEKTDSKYYNRTCECFARALEQYHATEAMDMGSKYFSDPTQVNEKVYNEQLKPLIEQFLSENKSLLKGTIYEALSAFSVIKDAFNKGDIDIDKYLEAKEQLDIIKGRSGVYSDNATNRRLKRVGQKYGDSKQQEEPKEKQGKIDTSKTSKTYSDKELANHAKNTSEADLKRQISEGKDSSLRSAAHKELERRSKEESVQEKEQSKDVGKENDRNKKKELNTEDLTGKFVSADEVATGKPVKISYAKNREKATKVKNQDFGQKIEPHGNYITNNPGSFKIEGWEYGEIEFKNPLVIEHENTSSIGWKGVLANKFGKAGRALSKELIKRGYDAIITTDSEYNELSEIVSLKDFN